VHQNAVVVKALKAIGLFHHDNLMPLSGLQHLERYERKWHAAISIDATHKEPAVVCTDEVVRPAFCAAKEALAACPDRRQTAACEGLFPDAAQKYPRFQSRCFGSVEFTGDIEYDGLVSTREFARGLICQPMKHRFLRQARGTK
jgi:hypothetical protein